MLVHVRHGGVIVSATSYKLGVPGPQRVRRIGIQGQPEAATRFGLVVREGYGLEYGPECGAAGLCFNRMDRRLLFVHGPKPHQRRYLSQKCTQFVAIAGIRVVWRRCHDGPGVTLKITNLTSWETRTLRLESPKPFQAMGSEASPSGRYLADLGYRRVAILDLRTGKIWNSRVDARGEWSSGAWSNDSRHFFYETDLGYIAALRVGERRPDIVRGIELEEEEGSIVAALPPSS